MAGMSDPGSNDLEWPLPDEPRGFAAELKADLDARRRRAQLAKQEARSRAIDLEILHADRGGT